MGWIRMLGPRVTRFRAVILTEQILSAHVSNPIALGLRMQGILMHFNRCITYSAVRTVIKKSPRVPAEVQAALEGQEKIQLFGLNNELMSVVTKREAKARADRDGLKLVEMDSTAKPYPVYQLMSGQDLYKHGREQKELKRASKMSEKTFRLAAKISSHDLDIKLKQMKENIVKGKRIKLTIQASKSASPEDAGQEHSKLLQVVREGLGDIVVVGKAVDTGRDLTISFKPKEESQESPSV